MSQELYTYNLPNGLAVVAERMEWLESAAFCLAVPAGCVTDPPHRLGLANFTCEMAQRGCGALSSREFIETLDGLGADRSSATSSVHTTYSASMLATNLIPVLKVYADLIQRPLLPEDQMEDARAVCLQELQAIEDDLAQKVMQRLRKEAYPEPWGRASQGSMDAVEQISHRDVVECQRRGYSPQGAILGIAGQFDWPELQQNIERQFGAWHGPPCTAPPIGPIGPVNVHLPHDSNQTQVAVAFPTVPFKHEDYLLARAAVGVLSDGMSARLFTEIREERGLCYTVYANHHSLKDIARVFCYAGTTTERAQETLDVMLAELVKLSDGITESELHRLKARTKSALIMQQESSAARAGSLVGDWYHLGYLRTLDQIHAMIDALSCERIGSYVRRHPAADFTVVTLGKDPLEVRVGVSA